MSSYNFSDEKLFKFGRFDMTHGGGTSPGLASQAAGIEFVCNDTSFTCNCAVVAGVSGQGFSLWKNGVAQTAPIVAPEGENAAGQFTVTGITSGDLIRITSTPGLVPYSWLKATATIVTGNGGGTISLRPGLLSGYQTEHIGDAAFVSHGSTNMNDKTDTLFTSPPAKSLTAFPCGQATRKGKCSSLVATYVTSNGNNGNAYLYVDGTLYATVAVVDSSLNVLVASGLDANVEHTYTIGAPKGTLDMWAWSGGTGPSSTDINGRNFFVVGNSIDAGDVSQDATANCQQGAVSWNRVAMRYGAQLWNIAISGDTIGNMHTRFAADTANCPASVNVACVGCGENDHALSGAAFTTALTTLLNDILTKWPSISRIVVRGEFAGGSGGATDTTKQNAIAACNTPSKCVFIAYPVGFVNTPSGTTGGTDTVDGQHPAPQGDLKLADQWDTVVGDLFAGSGRGRHRPSVGVGIGI